MNKHYAQALYEVTKDLSGKELEKAVLEFVKLLVKDNKLRSADKILNEFVKYSKKKSGIRDIQITSARKLDSKVVDEIKNIFGKETEYVENLDPTLIGGIKIKTEIEIKKTNDSMNIFFILGFPYIV